MSRYALAQSFTPILSTPKFRQIFGSEDGCSLPFDEQGLLRPIEMIAFPLTRFEVIQELENGILQVRTNEYPGDDLYIDRRFVRLFDRAPEERVKTLPKADSLLQRLHSLLGSQYIWGGNYHLGIPQLLEFYPPKQPIDPSLASKWTLRGVDCSGLLYQTTEGVIPRNTSDLVNCGQSILIEGKDPKAIAKLVKPLDLIVWRGHMVIAFDENRSIESRAGKGVVLCNLQDRLEEICLDRRPVNDWDSTTGNRFVIKRWILK